MDGPFRMPYTAWEDEDGGDEEGPYERSVLHSPATQSKNDTISSTGHVGR